MDVEYCQRLRNCFKKRKYIGEKDCSKVKPAVSGQSVKEKQPGPRIDTIYILYPLL